ncbi:ribosomal RNA small subunit methyltransferase A [Candidatus Parvarchaeota archaeon]|nr:ribosomal RNA small subunit methyltransferase A [Candidatus Parvarchaeota archaeon]
MLKKHLGQHLLVDQKILGLEAQLCNVEGEKVLEIGPGSGNLTQKLLESNPRQIICVEKDPIMVDKLKVRFAGVDRVKIVKQDFLDFGQDGFGRIVGNLPYYISSKILFKVAKMDFDLAVFCLQREFVARMIAKPGDRDYSRLSVETSKYFVPKAFIEVPAVAFHPQPKVDSVIISLEKKKPEADAQQSGPADIFIRAIFSHRKKTLRAAILAANRNFFAQKAEMKSSLDGLPHASQRVFKLTPLQLGQASEFLRKKGLEALV